jgi:hypothetical protein
MNLADRHVNLLHRWRWRTARNRCSPTMRSSAAPRPQRTPAGACEPSWRSTPVRPAPHAHLQLAAQPGRAVVRQSHRSGRNHRRVPSFLEPTISPSHQRAAVKLADPGSRLLQTVYQTRSVDLVQTGCYRIGQHDVLYRRKGQPERRPPDRCISLRMCGCNQARVASSGEPCPRQSMSRKGAGRDEL